MVEIIKSITSCKIFRLLFLLVVIDLQDGKLDMVYYGYFIDIHELLSYANNIFQMHHIILTSSIHVTYINTLINQIIILLQLIYQSKAGIDWYILFIAAVLCILNYKIQSLKYSKKTYSMIEKVGKSPLSYLATFKTHQDVVKALQTIS